MVMMLIWVLSHYQGDGIGWLSFAGEINVDLDVTIGGFKAAALWVKVCT
jgi:hypothetical protein